PGVFLGRGVLRLASLYGVLAGRRAVVLTDNDEGAKLAIRLSELGIEVAAIVDVRSTTSANRVPSMPQLVSHAVVAAWGRNRLRAVRVARVRDDGTAGESQEIACDLLCQTPSLQPANELLLQAGVRFRFSDERQLPAGDVPDVWAAGAVAGTLEVGAQ